MAADHRLFMCNKLGQEFNRIDPKSEFARISRKTFKASYTLATR